MRFVIITIVSLLIVTTVALQFFKLLDNPIILESQPEEPNIVFIDKADLYTPECKTAQNNFSSY